MGPLGPAGLAVAYRTLVTSGGLFESERGWNQEVASGAGRVHWAFKQRPDPAVLFHRLRESSAGSEFAIGLRENIPATDCGVHAVL